MNEKKKRIREEWGRGGGRERDEQRGRGRERKEQRGRGAVTNEVGRG